MGWSVSLIMQRISSSKVGGKRSTLNAQPPTLNSSSSLTVERSALNVERWTLNTPEGNPALIQIIRDQIENNGPQTFAWFMQQALYHPEHGYYSSGRCHIGREGDYFTNVSVGPLFGQLLASQFSEIWDRLGKVND